MVTRPDWIDPEVASEYLERGRAQLVDARPERSYQHSREKVPGSVHVDPGGGAAISDALFALPRERLFIAYCDQPDQAASAQVARRVRELGIGDGCYLAGGIRCWREASLPVEVTFAANHLAGERDGKTADGYVIERSTGHVRLGVAASSVEELFASAARAVLDVVLDAPRMGVAPSLELTVRAHHPEALLGVWLDEVLSQTRAAPRLARQVTVLSLTSRELRAVLRAAEPARWRVNPAAITIADVSLEQQPGGFTSAAISLDLGSGARLV